jgi:hypothetical protein
MLTTKELFAIKMQGYRTVAATEPNQKRTRQYRSSAILIDVSLNVQPLKERSMCACNKGNKGKSTYCANNKCKSRIELIGVKVIGDINTTYKNPFELWSTYCGPFKNEAITFSKMIKKLHEERKARVILAGDFNCDLTPDKRTVCVKVKDTLEMLQEQGQLSILNDYNQKTTDKNTILDLAVVMGDWDEGFAIPIEYYLDSTHFPVCIGVNTKEKTEKNEYVSILRYKRTKETERKIKTHCSAIRREIENYNAESLSQAILEMYKNEAKDSAPKKVRRKQRHWWNENIENLFMEKQDHLTRKGKDEQYKHLNDQLHKAINEAKNASFREFASGLNHVNNNSNVYRAMKTVGSRQPSKISELTVRDKSGNLVTSSKDKAETLSRRYQVPLGYHPKRSTLRKETLKKERKELETSNPKGLNHTKVTAPEARIAREEMANNKAPGLSRIKKEDLDIGGHELDTIVAHLADKIVTEGEWPQVLKSEINCAIPKDSEATDLIEEDQTRPITLLETLDKWLQKIIYNRIRPYIQYEETQAGYCLSCDHHTTLVTDFVMGRNDKAHTIAVFTDISKAFDSVPLDELVEVIWRSEIPAQYKWVLASFVEKREFRVEIRDINGKVAASKWRKRLYGTPQGSVLGPLLWNLFFDPLLKIIAKESEASTLEDLDTAFADDLTLLAASENPQQIEELLERKLNIFQTFLEERGMKAAAHKLKVMSLDPLRRNYLPQVHYNGELLEVVEEHKLLGVYYDKDMTFRKHWELVTTSVIGRTKTITALRAATWGPTQQTAIVLHRSYIESRICYGMMAWYPFLEPKLKNKLDVYLRRSIRIVMGLPVHCWNAALMAESDLDSVSDLALKCAVSLYSRINPTDETQKTLVKRHYQIKKPKWAKLLDKIPTTIWQGPIQAKLNKKILLTSDRISVSDKTLSTQKQAEAEEQNYKRMLYTDASVIRISEPPGKAAIAFIWYKKLQDGSWEEETRGSASIGHGHSSYSAEAIAIQSGLENDPQLETSHSGEQECTSTVGVFTDSLSNIATISKGIAETSEQEKLLRSVTQYPGKLRFHHVRSHQDNRKNNEVDKLCDANLNLPGRTDANHLGGKKTKAKIKQWTKNWTSKKRLLNVGRNRNALRRGSATQKWMRKCTVDSGQCMIPRPKAYNQLTRRKGVLLAKVRTNRWTECHWYLNFIKDPNTPSPLCRECKINDTTEHIVDECKIHEGPRSVLLLRLRHSGKVSDLLTCQDKATINELADFLVNIEDDRKDHRKKEAQERAQTQIAAESAPTGCKRTTTTNNNKQQNNKQQTRQ